MPDTDPTGLWPNKETLKAGDEDLAVAPDYMNDRWPAPRNPEDDWPKRRPFQEDGHLAADLAAQQEDPDD